MGRVDARGAEEKFGQMLPRRAWIWWPPSRVLPPLSVLSSSQGKQRWGPPTERETTAEGVSNEFRISLADERRDYFKEIWNYLISGEKVINSGETN